MHDLEIRKIDLVPISKDQKSNSAIVKYECTYCKKIAELKPFIKRISERIALNDYFCPSCIRQNFHTLRSRDILGVSFRGLISYYYHQKYLTRSLTFSELLDMVREHQAIGLQNPVFSYDPESFMWFLDFSKVEKEVTLNEVKKTIRLILESFRMTQHVDIEKEKEFLDKIKSAISAWHSQRKRPPGRKFVVPTITGPVNTDVMKHFFLENLVLQ